MSSEPFKADREDWEEVEAVSRSSSGLGEEQRCIIELRDRVAALEKKARTAEECNDAICRRLDEIRRKEPAATEESSVAAPAAPTAAVPPDRELMQMWNEAPRGVGLGLRVVWNHGYQQGLAAGRAEQQATKAVRVVLPETPCYPDLVSGGAYYLHGYDDAWAAARAMVEQQQAAQSDPVMATPEPEPTHPSYTSGHGVTDSATATVLDAVHHRRNPEPSPSPAEDAGLVRQVAIAIGGDDWEIWGEESRDVIRIVARWLRKKRYYLAAALLEPEANR